MKEKRIVCLLLKLLIIGWSSSLSLSGNSHENDPISIGVIQTTTKTATTAKINKTTKEMAHNIDNTIWEYIEQNDNYEYIFFKDDISNIDELK